MNSLFGILAALYFAYGAQANDTLEIVDFWHFTIGSHQNVKAVIKFDADSTTDTVAFDCRNSNGENDLITGMCYGGNKKEIKRRQSAPYIFELLNNGNFVSRTNQRRKLLESSDKTVNPISTDAGVFGGLSVGAARSPYIGLTAGGLVNMQNFLLDGFIDVGISTQTTQTQNPIGYTIDANGRCHDATGKFAKKEACEGSGGDHIMYFGFNTDAQYHASNGLTGGAGFRLSSYVSPYLVMGYKSTTLPIYTSVRISYNYFQIMLSYWGL